jgi:hypothetical protein
MSDQIPSEAKPDPRIWRDGKPEPWEIAILIDKPGYCCLNCIWRSESHLGYFSTYMGKKTYVPPGPLEPGEDGHTFHCLRFPDGRKEVFIFGRCGEFYPREEEQ